MAPFKKTEKAPSRSVLPPIYTPSDTTRTFDARPKPSNDRRREERVRPTQHIDQIRDPLDPVPGDEPAED